VVSLGPDVQQALLKACPGACTEADEAFNDYLPSRPYPSTTSLAESRQVSMAEWNTLLPILIQMQHRSFTLCMSPCACLLHATHRYLAALRPFSSIISLVVELLISCVELVLLVFALVNQQSAQLPSNPALVCIVLLPLLVSVLSMLGKRYASRWIRQA